MTSQHVPNNMATLYFRKNFESSDRLAVMKNIALRWWCKYAHSYCQEPSVVLQIYVPLCSRHLLQQFSCNFYPDGLLSSNFPPFSSCDIGQVISLSYRSYHYPHQNQSNILLEAGEGVRSAQCSAALTKCYRLGSLNSRNLFVTFLEARLSKVRCQPIWVLMKWLFLVCRQTSYYICYSARERERGRD